MYRYLFWNQNTMEQKIEQKYMVCCIRFRQKVMAYVKLHYIQLLGLSWDMNSFLYLHKQGTSTTQSSTKGTQPTQTQSPPLSGKSKTSPGTGEKIQAVPGTTAEAEELLQRNKSSGCRFPHRVHVWKSRETSTQKFSSFSWSQCWLVEC